MKLFIDHMCVTTAKTLIRVGQEGVVGFTHLLKEPAPFSSPLLHKTIPQQPKNPLVCLPQTAKRH